MFPLAVGVATYDFVEDNEKLRVAFEIADQTFLIIFTVECALQVGYHGYHIFKDAWLTFDFIIVLTSWTLSGAQIFRAFRGTLAKILGAKYV
jgi:Ion transport protein